MLFFWIVYVYTMFQMLVILLIDVVADIVMILVYWREPRKLDILCPILLDTALNKICFNQTIITFNSNDK